MSNRYIRQTLLPQIGKAGQQKLEQAHIAIIGCGGLGSIAAPYLAGAGVGKLSLIDGDQPDLSNIHRQVFFTGTESTTKSKLLGDHIKKLNPDIQVKVVSEMIHKNNIKDHLIDCDLVLECTDDMMTKYLVNDFCHLHQIPLVYGAIFKYEGYVSLFPNHDDQQIHLRDIFPEPDLDIPTCSEVGVLSTIAAMIGILQANEALKYILQIGNALTGQLLTYNVLTNEQVTLKLKKSYKESLNQIFHQSSYTSMPCETVPEISVDALINNMNQYKVISVMEKSEHESITEDVIHMPFSRFNLNAWNQQGQSLLYCQSGIRSAKLVKIILDNFPDAKVYSLKGGLTAYQNHSQTKA